MIELRREPPPMSESKRISPLAVVKERLLESVVIWLDEIPKRTAERSLVTAEVEAPTATLKVILPKLSK